MERIETFETALNILHANKDTVSLVMLCCPIDIAYSLDVPTVAEGVETAEQFAYEALHDPLTGFYDHSAYKMLLKDADQRNIALILIDVDAYWEYRQTNGDAVAERALHLVADVLKQNFRSVDFICHIGEDEFAVIMTRINNEHRPLIYEKVERINAMIGQHDEVPPFRLSCGVAFADRENPQGDIFHDADIALKQIQAMKKSGVVIFQ